MIEILPIKIESVVDFSLIIAILGGLAIYFGKLISEVLWKKEDKYAYYVQGGVFLVLFVIFPPLVLYTIFESGLILMVPLLYPVIIIPASFMFGIAIWFAKKYWPKTN